MPSPIASSEIGSRTGPAERQSMGKKIRVFLIDDHEMILEGLGRMLTFFEDIEVVGMATNAEEGLTKIKALTPEVILMDIKMPGMNGLEASRQFKAKGLPGRIVVLSLYDEYLADALEMGADGYLVKDVKAEELADAIRRVAQGELVLGESVAKTHRAVEAAIGRLQQRNSGETSIEDSPGSAREGMLPSQSKGRRVGGKEPPPSTTPAKRQARPQEAPPILTLPRIPPASTGGTSPSQDAAERGPSRGPLRRLPMPVPPEAEEEAEQQPDYAERGEPQTNGSITIREPTALVAQTQDASDFSSEALLLIPDAEADTLLLFYRSLKRIARAEIRETIGSWEGGMSLRIWLNKPLPLRETLATIPEVAQVQEDPTRGKGLASRFRGTEMLARPLAELPKVFRVVLKAKGAATQLELKLQ